MSSETAGRLEILAAALLFSTGGAAIKAAALTGWQVACFRSGVAALVILLLPGARRNWTPRAVIVGLAYGATLILFVLANKLTTSANAIFLQASAPFYLLLLGPWLLGERIRRPDLALVAILAAGMALFFLGRQEPLRTAPDPLTGNIIGAFAGLAWALTIAGLRWVAGRDAASPSALAPVVAGNLLAFSIALPFAAPVENARPVDWMLILYMGAFQVGLAYVCLTRGLRALPALEASLLLLAEPALNPIWSWLLHGERPAGLALVGGGLILAGTAGRMLRRERPPAPRAGVRTTSGAPAS